MNLRLLFQEFNNTDVLQVFTTEGHIYVGRISDLKDDLVELRSANGRTSPIILYGDISSVRPLVEEPEEAV